MKANMGTADKAIRILMALLIVILYFTNQISGTVAIVLGVLAVVFIATSTVGFCPLYSIFNISTKQKS